MCRLLGFGFTRRLKKEGHNTLTRMIKVNGLEISTAVGCEKNDLICRLQQAEAADARAQAGKKIRFLVLAFFHTPK